MTLARLLSLAAPPLCWGCGASAAGHAPLCRTCRAGQRWLQPVGVPVAGIPTWAPVAYEGAAKALVGALKFRGAAGLADHMAAAILARPPPGLVEGATLVPVPLHPARLRRRGFNQAGLIAAAMAARSRLPLEPLLRRRGERAAQVGRGRTDRLQAVQGSVSAEPPVSGRVVLVDDVITTGATLAACAGALHAAGAREVAAVAYARTLGR